MLDEYYRNGKLFLAEMEKERREDFSSIGEVLRVIDVTDEFIRKNFRKPVEELVGSSNVGSTEKDMLKAMKKYFEVSGRSIRYGEILALPSSIRNAGSVHTAEKKKMSFQIESMCSLSSVKSIQSHQRKRD